MPSISSSKVIAELVLLALFNLLMLILFCQIDLLEKLYHFSTAHEHYELDEIIPLFITLSISLALFSYRRWSEQKQLQLRVLAIATHDDLTGVFNRRGIDIKLNDTLELSRRTEMPFSVILVDLDNLKTINDNYGHHVGDSVLKRLASILNDSTRVTDKVARWGGDEFLILCPATDAEDASHIAEKLTNIIQSAPFSHVESCSASMGVATLRKNDTPDSIIARADERLYKAKNNGKSHFVSGLTADKK